MLKQGQYTNKEVKIFQEALKKVLEEGIEPVQAGVKNERRFRNWRRTKSGTAFENSLRKGMKRPPKNPRKSPRKSPSKRDSARKALARVKQINLQIQKQLEPALKHSEEEVNSSTAITSTPRSNSPLFSSSSSLSSHSSMSSTSMESVHDNRKYSIENYPLKIDRSQLKFVRTPPLGEGQNGLVALAQYQGLTVAVKYRRIAQNVTAFAETMARELTFAAKLSACRYTNTYIGLLQCMPQHIKVIDAPKDLPAYNKLIRPKNAKKSDLYIVQKYFHNGDLRDYMEKRQGSPFHLLEVLQIGLCIFASLTDAHKLDIGIVDLKLENILIDTAGSAWLTDFGSCVTVGDGQMCDLEACPVFWTKGVAAPEMLRDAVFCKKSDIFMAALILLEILTPHLSDEEFAKQILVRDAGGNVTINEKQIPTNYSCILPILRRCLDNDYSKRPQAAEVLRVMETKKAALLEILPFG